MIIDEAIEKQNVSEETRDTQSGRRTESVKWVDMGKVSVETKGIIRGLELGLTPKD